MRYKTTFDHKIRSEWLHVEASGWSDGEGLYRVRVDGAFLDDVNVLGLLTEEDILELESAIPGAFFADAADHRVTGGIPGHLPTL